MAILPPARKRPVFWDAGSSVSSSCCFALRWRAHRVAGAPDSGRFLAGGRIPPVALEKALRQPTRAEAVAKLIEAARRADWRAPLERIAAGGDLPTLQRELETSRVRWAVGLFLRGDPLGLDVPIAFTVALVNEVRNLRLLGESAAGRLSTAAVRPQLIVPWGGRWDD